MNAVKRPLFFIAIAITGILIGIGGTLLFQKIWGPKQTVNITGHGVVEASSDQAFITFSVTNRSWSQDQAQKDNKLEVQKIKSQLLALGIPDSRISVSSDTIVSPPVLPPEPFPLRDNQKPELQYQPSGTGVVDALTASTSLTVTLDPINRIESVLAVINGNSNTKLVSTSYTLKNSAPFEAQARQKALTDARKQVEAIASINKLHVGKLTNITNISNPMPIYKEGMMAPSGQSASSSFVSYGEKTINISASYNVSYELY